MTSTVTAALIVGILLSSLAVILGLWMLLSKREAIIAEGEWLGKAKVKGPVGLIVFCVGVVLLVVSTRQLASPSVENGTNEPPTALPGGGSSTAGGPPAASGGRTLANFISPPEGAEIGVFSNVTVAGSVVGLDGAKLWIVSRHNQNGIFYTVSYAINHDGSWSVVDGHVGNRSDEGETFTYYAIKADVDCDKTLSSESSGTNPFFENMPPTCIILGTRTVKLK